MMNQIAQITNPSIGNLSDRIGLGGGTFVSDLLRTGLTIILIVGTLFFVVQLLTGGVDWIRSGGDKTQLEAARGKLFGAILGIVLLFAAFAIITLISNIFGVSILQLNIPTLESVGGNPTGSVWCPAIDGWCDGRCTAAGCMTR